MRPAETVPQGRPLRVRVVEIEPRDVVLPIKGFGTVKALRSSNITAEVAGTIVYRSDICRVGCEVAKGQVLFRLDERDYAARVEQLQQAVKNDEALIRQIQLEQANLISLLKIARAEERIARDEYERLTKLYSDNYAAKTERDAAEAAWLRIRRQVQQYEHSLALIQPRLQMAQASLKMHESQLNLAKVNLDRCQIRAPFAGRIAQVTADVGQTVAPGQVLAVLIDPSRVEIPVELPASLRNKVKIGAEAVVTLQADRTRRWKGQVSRLSPTIETLQRTFSAFVEIENLPDREELLPGEFVEVTIRGPRFSGAIVIPRTAVRGRTVFVAKDGKAQRRRIEVAEYFDESAIVAKGLSAGESLIISNLDMLYDGAPIEIGQIVVAAAASEAPQ